MKTANPREAAFLASWTSSQGIAYASDLLDHWQREQKPSAADFRLARQICYGTIQMALALDYLGKQLTNHGTLKVKAKERMLLRSALYQAYFLERTPLYSIVDESVRLAKKHFHPNYAKFLNALLRSYEEKQPTLPIEKDSISLSIRYSYPKYFIEELITAYGLEKTEAILTIGNTPAKVTARVRHDSNIPPDTTEILEKPLRVIRLEEANQLSSISNSSDFYIQNVTPVALLSHLAQVSKTPTTILDLCAAPGGKTLAVHDLFPQASITANDASEVRLEVLRENFKKYGLDIPTTCYRGELYPTDQKFDLIILDVPCSNSGVLNKRPEARWRITPESVQQLKLLQEALVKHAMSLLTPSGQLWYLTCSILPSENEALCKQALFAKTILPTGEGWDGGFGCLIATN